MKKLVITALAILTVFGLSACGNVQNADKNVETSATTSASANTVTTVTTSSATTSMGDVVTTAPTSTSEGEPIVTTSTNSEGEAESQTNSTTILSGTSDVATTTTTVATKKPSTTSKKTTTTTAKKTTTTAKKTTTTAKKTTTTAKKTSAKVENVSSNTSKGKTMWVSKDQSVVYIKNQMWGYEDWNVYKGDKVTAYETVTLPGDTLKVTKIKTSDGKTGYTTASILSSTEVKVTYLTQSDIDKIVEELQEYSTALHFEINETRVKADIEELKDKLPADYGWETYKKEVKAIIDEFTPENSSWIPTTDVYTTDSYDEAYKIIKRYIDYNYEEFPDSHIVVYLRWCPKGKGNTNTFETKDCWEVYALR